MIQEIEPLEKDEDRSGSAAVQRVQKLRAPLNGIGGNLLLLRETQLDQEQRRMTDFILQGCQAMEALVEEILDAFRLEAGQFPVKKEEFGLRKMLNGVIDANIAAVNEKGLHLLLHVPEPIPEYVVGDEACITRILNQLFSYAITDTDAGSVSLELERIRETVEELELIFWIKNTGRGRFLSEDSLGMTLARQLAGLLGGELEMRSENENGSAVSLHLCLGKAIGASQNRKDGREMAMLFQQWNENTVRPEYIERCFIFGTQENTQEIRGKMEKLIICLELEAWDHAEYFAGNLKALLQGREDLAKMVFRLELCLRREDYGKSMQRYQELKDRLENELISGNSRKEY